MIDAKLFLELANSLLSDKSYGYEAAWCTAVGRAYYAAFLKTKERLESLGCNFADVDKIHQQVIIRLMERNTDVGNMLDTLRSRRVDADYYMSKSIPPDLAKRCTKLSERILGSLVNLQSEL